MATTLDINSGQSCIGKQSFESPAAAAKAKERLARRWNASRRTGLHPYKCNSCKKYHLGNPPNGGKMSNKDRAHGRRKLERFFQREAEGR